MKIRKSRLKQIIKEEVANFKFIDIEESIMDDSPATQESEADEEESEASAALATSLDEIVVQEIFKALGEGPHSHTHQARTLDKMRKKGALSHNQQGALDYHSREAEKEKPWGGNKGDQNRSATKGEKSLDGAEDYEPVFEEEKLDLNKALDKGHEGYCTPMSKSTCTPPRKAMAKRLKPGGDLYRGKKA